MKPAPSSLRNLLPFLAIWAACTSGEPSRTSSPVLMVSMDGFRPSYIDSFDTPNLDRLVREGVISEGMIPVFPSKTYPTHYSIVTGLHPENTGLIANNMYDPEFGAYYSLSDRSAVMDGRWYGGEPIWNTAERQGLRTATLFWPGSEATIGGLSPTRWKPYDGDMPYRDRIDTVVAWLSLTDASKPRYVNLYFSASDTYGHLYGPHSDSTRAAVERLDADFGYLIDRLEEAGIWTNVNLVVTSDHGMTEISPDRLIFLDQIIDLDQAEVIDWSPVAMIRPHSGQTASLYNALKSAAKGYTVYLREDLPVRFRLKNHSRVPEIVLVADLGYTVTTTERFAQRGLNKGDHGYDNQEPDMYSLFLAHGPAFNEGQRIGRFQSVHVYELVAHLLGIKPAKNDGSLDSLRLVLKTP